MKSCFSFLLLFFTNFCFSQSNSQNKTSALNCNNWLRVINNYDRVNIGDLDVPGNKITIEANLNLENKNIITDIVSKNKAGGFSIQRVSTDDQHRSGLEVNGGWIVHGDTRGQQEPTDCPEHSGRNEQTHEDEPRDNNRPRLPDVIHSPFRPPAQLHHEFLFRARHRVVRAERSCVRGQTPRGCPEADLDT